MYTLKRQGSLYTAQDSDGKPQFSSLKRSRVEAWIAANSLKPQQQPKAKRKP